MVGFATPVTVTATATGNGPFTYAWTQTAGAPVTLTGATTATIGFRTTEFVQALGYLYPDSIVDGGVQVANARCGTLGVNRDQAAHSAFQVVVTDANGVSTSRHQRLRDAPHPRPSQRTPWNPGLAPRKWPRHPPGRRRSDELELAAHRPHGLDSNAFCGRRRVRPLRRRRYRPVGVLLPDVIGEYTLTETGSSTTPCTFIVYAAKWLGIMTITGPTDSPPVQATSNASFCVTCHAVGDAGIAPDEFTPWSTITPLR